MELSRPFKSILYAFLRLIKGMVQKEVSRLSGLKLDRLFSIERGETRDASCDDLARAFTALGCTPAEAIIATAGLEAFSSLDRYEDLEKAAAREQAAAAAARRVRRRLRAAGASGAPPAEAFEYPAPWEVALNRAEARDSWHRLKTLENLEELSLVVRNAREHQGWAVVERLCEESERAAAKHAGRALVLALVAVLAAASPFAPESWRRRLLGYAAAHLANALRVAGRLEAAERLFFTARRLWEAGRDPDGVLDPGRLLDLEASLRRDQRRFAESLALLEKAAAVTRRPEHVALKTAFALEVMGEFNRAIEILLDAGPRVENHPEARLKTIQRFNLAAALTRVGRHQEAAGLLPSIRRLAEELQDDLDLVRSRWLDGRVAAGLGQTNRALRALEEARHAFAQRDMDYDVCLSLLETAALRLDLGDHAGVQRLAAELAPVFERKGVHEEALKALRLFDEAVARQTATPELVRGLLDFFFRARYDPELKLPLAPAAG
jgi:tetratricopeptide (TPR) repeat protein